VYQADFCVLKMRHYKEKVSQKDVYYALGNYKGQLYGLIKDFKFNLGMLMVIHNSEESYQRAHDKLFSYLLSKL
jgi:hypothetical protein